AGLVAASDVGPSPHGTVAIADLDAEIRVAPQLRNIDVGKVGVGLAVPFMPVAVMGGQQRLAKQAAYAEAFAPRGGWRRVQPQGVPARAVAHDEVDLVQ